jgi:hypothetical protein
MAAVASGRAVRIAKKRMLELVSTRDTIGEVARNVQKERRRRREEKVQGKEVKRREMGDKMGRRRGQQQELISIRRGGCEVW